MKRTTKIIATLLVSTSFAAAPAMAANLGGVARGPAKDNTGNMMTTEPNTGATGATADNGHAVVRGTNKSDNTVGMGADTTTTSSVSASTMADSLRTAHVNAVHVVNVNSLATNGDTTANVTATNTTPQEQRQIRSALSSNQEIMNRLNSESVKLSSVVAANNDGNGTVTVYVR